MIDSHAHLDSERYDGDREAMLERAYSAGVHPHEARLISESALLKLDGLLCEKEVLACGEIGLDYFYEHSDRDQQRAAFARQMDIAAARRKPIVIHCRPSD